jgi:hypothetical protein
MKNHLRILALSTLLAAATTATDARAQSNLVAGQSDTFEMSVRFSTRHERPEQNAEIVDVEIYLEIESLVKLVNENGTIITAKIKDAGYRSIEDSGVQIYALSYNTDPDKRDNDLNIYLPNIEDLKGKVFDFVLPADGTEYDLLRTITEILKANFDIKFYRQIVSEYMFSRIFRWNYTLNSAHQKEWSEQFEFHLKPDGIIHFNPEFIVQNPGDQRENISIEGFVYYEDDRDTSEYAKGLQELKIETQSISGNAIWDTTLQRTIEFNLKIRVSLAPKDEDPLGMRVYNKVLIQEYKIKRLP